MDNWYFKARLDWDSTFEDLTDDEVGRLMKAIWHYARTGEVVKPGGAERIAFSIFIKNLIADEGANAELSKKRKAAGIASGMARRNASTRASDDKQEEAKQTNVHCVEQNGTNVQNDEQNELYNSNSNRNSNSNSKSKEIIITGEQSETDCSPAVISLPLQDGTEHKITQADFEKYSELYPAVDVMQELRKMYGWLDSKPKNRKTRTGVRSFITRWLAKAQDAAPKVTFVNATQKPVVNPFMDMLDREG